MSKYYIGQRVLINKIFSVSENIQGTMVTLDKPVEAIILDVNSASFGPCYSIKWVDPDMPKPKIKYWEDDILGPVTK